MPFGFLKKRANGNAAAAGDGPTLPAVPEVPAPAPVQASERDDLWQQALQADFARWVKANGFQEYHSKFEEHGYDNLYVMKSIGKVDADIDELFADCGISKKGHVKHMRRVLLDMCGRSAAAAAECQSVAASQQGTTTTASSQPRASTSASKPADTASVTPSTSAATSPAASPPTSPPTSPPAGESAA
eukprot:TRINITY_DN39781_c0_g1_i1.p2 TRINITY_DN39781_c0_g1~~TRINITY_DN39781_c0_g1_i1.p2  ORF type:complete len:188 (+),score=50.78 TRINITY_DN39781_c0_g1_i1:138-701(+)